MKLRSGRKSLPRWASYVAYSAKAGGTQCMWWIEWVDWEVHFLGFGLAFGISLAWEDVLEVLLDSWHFCIHVASLRQGGPSCFCLEEDSSWSDHISLIPLISREQVSGRNANPSYCNTRWAWSFPATLLQVAEEGRSSRSRQLGRLSKMKRTEQVWIVTLSITSYQSLSIIDWIAVPIFHNSPKSHQWISVNPSKNPRKISTQTAWLWRCCRRFKPGRGTPEGHRVVLGCS